MTRWTLAAAFVALTAAPLAAFEIDTMSEAERDSFRAEIRSYLLDNPEVLLEAISILEERQTAQQAAGDEGLVQANAEAIFDDGYSWVGGNPDGDVTVVEFLDYRCGFCKRAHPEVTELLSSDGNIRFIVKEFPILGDESVLASKFAIAIQRVAGDDAYARMHDTLMTFRGQINPETLRTHAIAQDLDADAIFAAMDDPEIDIIIAANRALAQRLQINGTPSFIFEDQMLRGYVPLDGMRQVVTAVRGEG